MKKIISIVSMVFVLSLMFISIAKAADPVVCPQGHIFSIVTGEKCTTFSASVSCPQGNIFSTATGERCTIFTGSVFCSVGQMFSTLNGEKCTVFFPNNTETYGYNFGTNTVVQGTVGENCTAWQIFFNNKRNAGLVVDGRCGPLTMSVARAWQASVGLPAAGVLGPMSRSVANTQ